MIWEAVTAIGTVFTGIVIFFTVILGRHQIDQLRRATQLEGITRIFEEMDSPEQLDARRFVRTQLSERMKEESFRREIELGGFADESRHKELIVLRFYERVGALIAAGIVDGSIIFAVGSGRIAGMWNALEDVVEIQRRSIGTNIWQNFERLRDQTIRWNEQHGWSAEAAARTRTVAPN